MTEITPGMMKWLRRLAEVPLRCWPDRPFLNDKENAVPLMRLGLIEVVKPGGIYLSYARITDAGLDAVAHATPGELGEK